MLVSLVRLMCMHLSTSSWLCLPPGHTGHSRSITSMACHPDNHLVLTGSTDVTAKLFNTTSNKVSSACVCTCRQIQVITIIVLIKPIDERLVLRIDGQLLQSNSVCHNLLAEKCLKQTQRQRSLVIG